MPLHGKLVVIKRSGVDGTEFPVTASCLFGRNPDCDIRIQLSQVSKEHCKIELNENKEVILTNLSVVNPTRINGQVMRQSERLKHGDLITIIDRSFRFEYPPEPTPKKRRPSASGKCETLQVLHDQQVRDHSDLGSVEEGKSSLPSSEKSCLKDGTYTGNLQSTTGKNGQDVDVFRAGLEQSKQSEEKSLSPFCELYHIMKQNLDTKSPRKPPGSAPSERASLRKAEKPVCATPQSEASAEGSGTGDRSPLKILGGEDASPVAPTTPAEGQEEDSSQGGRSVRDPSNAPCVPEGRGTPAFRKKTRQGTPKKFRPEQVAAELVSQDPSDEEGVKDAEKYETPKARRSRELTPRAQSASELNQEVADAEVSPAKRTSPRKSAGKRLAASDVVFQLESVAPPSGQENASSGHLYSSKRRKSRDLDVVLPTPQTKRKRVSFGGHLSPELFDKRLPPDSPLRKGATPRRSSLFVLQKRHSLLNRASAVGLKQGLCAEKSSPKCLKALESPKKGVASLGATLSPAKSPRVKAKTPSPGKQKLPNLKAKTPSPGRKSLSAGVKTPSPGRKSPSAGVKTPSPGRKSPSAGVKTPSPGRKSPSAGVKTPSPGRKSPSAGVKTPSPGRKSPSAGVKTPKKLQSVTPESKEPLTPCPSQHGRMSFSDPEPLPETPCLNRGSPSASTPATKTPPPRRSLNGSVANQSASSLGRFSVSRIETPSPVANQNTGLPECVPAAARAPETQNVPLRRKSVKLSRKTPQSTRKNVLEVIRSRRSGASRANLKVVSSWADVVKFGASKSEAFVPAKKRRSKGKTVKKTVTRQPKTPAQKVRDHFSTGHAASPVTIVVGRAHARTAPTGCAPKLVPNVALLRKNMAMNEDLTGLAEIFTTPVNMRQKRIGTGGRVCSENPQDVLASPVLDTSVMNTPEETGEMVISPLSTVSTAKRGSYNNDAVVRLLQEHDSSFTDILQGMSDTVTTAEDIQPVEVTPADSVEETDSVSERLVRTRQPLEAVSEVRRVQEVVDFRGIKRLLKTPRGPKVSREVSLVGVKELLKTPKVKGLPVEDLAGVKRIMRTPKVKPVPVVSTTGVKRLMQTPKRKNEPVEDLIGVKRLLQTPEHLEKSPKQKNEPVEDMVAVKSLVRTPKQKNEPVEDMVAVKSLVRTPKQKNEPVEDMVAVKSLVRTPKQKNEPVEDMVGVKRLLQTPKQKNEPVEDMVGVKRLLKSPKVKGVPVEKKFGIGKLMKSPRLKGGVAVEDYTGLQELMEEPLEDSVPQVGFGDMSEAGKVSENPISPESRGSDEIRVAHEKPENLLAEIQSDNPIKSARRGRKKQSENISVGDPKMDGSVSPVESACNETEAAAASCAVAPQAPARAAKSRGRRARTTESAESAASEGSLMPPESSVEANDAREPEPAVSDTPPVKGRRGRRAVDIAEKPPAPPLVRKAAKRRLAKGKVDEASGAAETLPETPAEDACVPEKPPAPPLVRKAAKRRLAKGKVDEASGAAETLPETPAEDACVPEKPPAPPLVRKAAKRRLAKGKVDEASGAAETLPETPAEDACDQIQSPIVPVSKPRRGRKPKIPNGDALASENDPSEANAKSEAADAPEKPTPIKSGRGRKLKVVSEAKRARRGTADSEPQAAVCPGQTPKPVRGRKAPRGLDEVAAPLQSDVASPECSEPIRKTRGSRKRVSARTPVRPEEADPSILSAETSAAGDLMINKRQYVPRKGKVPSQEPEPNRADPRSGAAEESTDEVKSTGQMPKKVTWISDLVEVKEMPVPARGSRQRKPKGVADARDLAVEPEQAVAQITKSHRGRVGRAPVIEHPAPVPRKEAASKRVLSQPAKDVPPAAKKGVKRELTRDEPAEGAAVDDEPTVSSRPGSALKRARGRSRKEEVSVEAVVSEKRRRGPVKQAGSALKGESKPAVRDRKGGTKVAQQGPKPSQGSAGETAGNQESAGTGSTETQTRGRARSEKKLDPPSSAEVLAVRRTRRK